jgi:hypothetical protein
VERHHGGVARSVRDPGRGDTITRGTERAPHRARHPACSPPSISGAFFATASIWCLIAVGSDARSARPSAPASRAHLVTSALVSISTLVTHILGFFPEAFVLLYAGGASMLVAAVFTAHPERRVRSRAAAPGVVTAAGILVLTVGLLI